MSIGSVWRSIREVVSPPPRTLADIQAKEVTVALDPDSEVPGTFYARMRDEHGLTTFHLSGEYGDPAAIIVDSF